MCKCWKKSNPVISYYNKKKNNRLVKSIRWALIIMSVVLIGWFLPDFQPDKMKYREMRSEDLNKGPAIKFSPIDFLSENVKEKQAELIESMRSYCRDDVLFAFQFSKSNRTVQDHIFMLCSEMKMYGNAEVIDHSDKYVLCSEQYADIEKKIKRYSEVVIKAIDLETWDVVEYKSETTKESCIIQHAIDVLNSNWV